MISLKCKEKNKTKTNNACRLLVLNKQTQQNQFPPPQDVHHMYAGFLTTTAERCKNTKHVSSKQNN